MSNSLRSPRDAGPPGDPSEDDLEEIGALLEDEYARAILKHTSERPLSANELIDRCDASKTTTYRRIDRLRAYDLLESYREFDPDGHHYEVFEATLEEVTVRFADGEFELSLSRSTDRPDRVAGVER